jgi:hypothetical protein
LGPPICVFFVWLDGVIPFPTGTPFDQIIEVSLLAFMGLAFLGPIVLAVIAMFWHPGGNAIENFLIPLAAIAVVICWPFIFYVIEARFEVIKIVI